MTDEGIYFELEYDSDSVTGLSPPETCIAQYLSLAGFGTTGTDIFINTRPNTPDNLLTVFGYAGSGILRTHDTSGNEQPGIQVYVRNASAGTARTNISNVLDVLDGLANTTMGDRFFLNILANQSPTPLGKDENGRTQYVLNFSTIVRRG